jgi:hypothetical protein
VPGKSQAVVGTWTSPRVPYQLEVRSAMLIETGMDVYTRDELARHCHNEQFETHYEMSADDENGNEIDAGTWSKVESGDLGNVIYWESGFEASGEVQSILSQLEEVGEENVDWESLIGEHSYFAGIENADFRPLYDVTEFETCFDDFLAIEEEPTENFLGLLFTALPPVEYPEGGTNPSRMHQGAKRCEAYKRETRFGQARLWRRFTSRRISRPSAPALPPIALVGRPRLAG